MFTDNGESDLLKILVCGGGNGAHCLAALAASRPNVEVRVLTLFQDEAERWTKALEEGNMTLTIQHSQQKTEDVKSRPVLVTKDPAKAVAGIHMIFVTVPAFAHEGYLQAITPHVLENTLLIGLPGQAGFEFQCMKHLGEKAKQCAVASFESLPWACRIVEFGKHVQLLGFKESLGGAILAGSKSNFSAQSVTIIQGILGKDPHLKMVDNYIAVNLMAKSFVHPPLMYGKWRNFDGKALPEKPLFYQGIDEEQASLLSKVSDEIINTAQVIAEKRKVDMSAVIHIFDWFKEYYSQEIADKSSLMTAMRTNSAYNGLVHPMKTVTENGEGYVPDFSYRYLREDIPFGLVVMKGIAELAGVATPTIDEVIAWGQEKLGMEFIVGSELRGKDIDKTRAPQRYGFVTMDSLFDV